MIPRWADDISELEGIVINAQGQTVNSPRAGSTGEGVHIGIIDSAWRLPSEITETYDVVERPENSFIDVSDSESNLHAREVFHRVSAYCPGAKFTLYQAVNESNSLPLAAYSDAISSAIQDGVDILNISAGDPWPAPINLNPNVHETQRAIDEDIIVVAAAGNYGHDESEKRPPVHCPSAHGPVVSVGAMEVHCPAEIGSEPEDECIGPYYCFAEDPSNVIYDGSDQDTYCSQQGCVGGEECLTHQREVEWEGNPLPTNNKPDVLAPMLAPQSEENGHSIRKGTSFAAPVVTGSLGCILGAILSESMERPDPYEVREAVRSGSSPIDSGNKSKYDAMGTRRALNLI